MNEQLKVQTQTVAQPTFIPTASGLVRRQCACGQHTSMGGECEVCARKHEGTLQREAINPSPVHEVPPIVHEVLKSPGQPRDATTRAFMEPRFGQDSEYWWPYRNTEATQSLQAAHGEIGNIR